VKRAWRKADVDDVEEALEDERLVSKMKQQAHKGKNNNDDVTSLFTVDTSGSAAGLSKLSKREAARARLFPPKAPKLGYSASELAKIGRAEGQLKPKKNIAKTDPEVFDMWSSGPPVSAATSEDVSTSRVRRPATVKRPRTLEYRPSVAPAVIPAKEGQSVNPSQTSFEDIACLAAAKELEKEREDAELGRKMRPISAELADAVPAETLKGLDDEAKMNLYQSLTLKGNAEAETEGNDEDGQRLSGKRKSQAQRNKEKKRKDIDVRQSQLQTQKKLEKSVGEVGAILRDMREKDEWYKNRKEYRMSQRKKRRELEATEGVVPKTRRLGRNFTVVDEVLAVPDVMDGAKSLRSMPLKVSAIQDRMGSIVRRGLLPAPPAATRAETDRHKKTIKRLKRTRKFRSPLLREGLN